jgi:hypothetical protein
MIALVYLEIVKILCIKNIGKAGRQAVVLYSLRSRFNFLSVTVNTIFHGLLKQIRIIHKHLLQYNAFVLLNPEQLPVYYHLLQFECVGLLRIV